MRYIAKKIKGSEYEIKGIKEYETLTGEKVEVVFDTVTRDLTKLLEVVDAYTKERDTIIEKYNADIKDMEDIIEAMRNA